MSNTPASVSATSTKNRAAGTEINSRTDQELIALQQRKCLLLLVIPGGCGDSPSSFSPLSSACLKNMRGKGVGSRIKNTGRKTNFPKSVITLDQLSLYVGTNKHPKARVWTKFLAVPEKACDIVSDNSMSQG